jgi:hypothetical protein
MNGYYNESKGLGLGVLGFLSGMVVWALFGDKIKQKVNESRAYQEMKAEIMEKANSVRNMTETQYHKIVDEVSATYAKANNIRHNEIRDLVSDLKFHWARIKDRWNEPPRSNTGITSADSDPNISDGFNFRT